MTQIAFIDSGVADYRGLFCSIPRGFSIFSRAAREGHFSQTSVTLCEDEIVEPGCPALFIHSGQCLTDENFQALEANAIVAEA